MSACPPFSIEAAVSGRTISPETLAGKKAVLVLHGPATREAPKEVGKAVRAVHQGTDVVVANIVNLETMAGIWSKVANAQIKKTYESLAAKVTDADPADYIMICPDYENAVATAFGFPKTNERAAIVVLSPDGTIVGQTDEGNLAEQALAWLS